MVQAGVDGADGHPKGFSDLVDGQIVIVTQDDGDAMLVILRYYHDLPIDEIAETLGEIGRASCRERVCNDV